jgi:hypothetical protein
MPAHIFVRCGTDEEVNKVIVMRVNLYYIRLVVHLSPVTLIL